MHMRSDSMLLRDLLPDQMHVTFTERPIPQKQGTDWSIDPRVINDYDLFVCLSGSAVFRVQDAEYLLSRGEALLVPPYTIFSARHGGQGRFEAVAQHFTVDVLGRYDLFSLIRYERHVRFDRAWPYVAETVRLYIDSWQQDGTSLFGHAHFLTLLTQFLRKAYRGESADTAVHDMFIIEMAHLLQTRFASPDVMEEAISRSPYSRDYTTRLFREHTGVTPKQYLIQARIRAAREMLQQGSSVKDAAFATGHKDELYFSRLFRQKTGTPPSAYRSGV
ncbi:MAG: AraC family transcriptional regulator [Spirochaetaceae bacterium]|nr:MAG: AraC family transcriptional regulator [Spirochaetaceae bacterium]